MNQQEAIEAAKDLPWAKWVAQDRNGSWWAYDSEPDEVEGEGVYIFGGELCKELYNPIARGIAGPKAEVTR